MPELGEKEHSHAFPSYLTFLLDNPIRRRLDPPGRVLEKLGIAGDMAVLDFGCGPGFYTIPFARVAKRVVAVDLQPSMLEKVGRKAARAGVKVETLESDGKHVDLPDGSVDLIFLNHVYHEVDDKATVLVELRRLLTPGGRLVVVESGKKPFLGLGPPAMNPEKITAEMERAGFPKIRTEQVRSRVLVTATN